LLYLGKRIANDVMHSALLRIFALKIMGYDLHYLYTFRPAIAWQLPNRFRVYRG